MDYQANFSFSYMVSVKDERYDSIIKFPDIKANKHAFVY